MANGRVLVTHALPGDAVARLRAEHDVDLGPPLGDAVPDRYDAWVTLLVDRVDEARLARATRLKIVANVAVGVDNIDLASARARGVVVTNTPGVLTEATADLAFALLLAAARRVAEGDRTVRGGGWTGWSPSFMLGARVHGATLGIVGLGRIGQAVARRARGFGMHVLYTQRTPLPLALERALGAAFVPEHELVSRSDFVSLHCPLTDETRGMFGAARLGRMKPGSVLVNTARGPIVDEEALAHALAHGPLAGAGLDVFADEPRVHPALLASERVVLTPHIGSADRPTREAMARIAAENVLAVLAGNAAPNAV
jgi:glyoxylate reductase